MNENHRKYLEDFADQIQKLRVEALFTEQLEDFEGNNMACHQYLTGLAYLELADRHLRLAALYIPPALPIPPPLEHPAPLQEGVGSSPCPGEGPSRTGTRPDWNLPTGPEVARLLKDDAFTPQ